MFDDENGVFEVAEVFQSGDELVIVALVEADRRLVENVEDALEAGADLGGKANALSFAAGKSVGGATKLEITKADVFHKLDAFADFFDDWFGNHSFAFGELEVVFQDFKSGVDVKIAHVDNVKTMDSNSEDGGLETGAVTGLTLFDAHETLNILPNELGIGLLMAAFEGRDNAFVGRLVGCAIAPFAVAADFDFVFFFTGAVKENLDSFLGKLANRDMDREAMAFANSGQAFQPPRFLGDAIERANAAFGNGEVRVQDEIRVDFHAGSETGTSRAGALRGVEGEEARLELGDELVGMKLAGIALGEGKDFGFAWAAFDSRRVVVNFEEFDNSLAELEGLLDRAGDAREEVGA